MQSMHPVLELLSGHMYVVVILIICLGVVAGSLIRAVTEIMRTQARERSRREIAAYIAEGSLSPEQGERLLRADVSADRRRA